MIQSCNRNIKIVLPEEYIRWFPNTLGVLLGIIGAHSRNGGVNTRISTCERLKGNNIDTLGNLDRETLEGPVCR